MFFLLSGYGCFISLKKREGEYVKWFVKHLLKMIMHYIIAYILVVVVLILFFGENLSVKDIIFNFVTLRMPGSTTWYFKIQILFYIILACSIAINKKYLCVTVSLLSLVYAIVSRYCLGLPDFWWKTSLCFAAGCWIANYRNTLCTVLDKTVPKLIIVMCGLASYFVIFKDGQHRFVVQIVAYVIISVFIVMLWDCFAKRNRLLTKAGLFSLDIYLIHIGIVESVFLQEANVNVKTIQFVIMVIAATVIGYFISEILYKKISSKI